MTFLCITSFLVLISIVIFNFNVTANLLSSINEFNDESLKSEFTKTINKYKQTQYVSIIFIFAFIFSLLYILNPKIINTYETKIESTNGSIKTITHSVCNNIPLMIDPCYSIKIEKYAFSQTPFSILTFNNNSTNEK